MVERAAGNQSDLTANLCGERAGLAMAAIDHPGGDSAFRCQQWVVVSRNPPQAREQ